jgi:hypothetical protein
MFIKWAASLRVLGTHGVLVLTLCLLANGSSAQAQPCTSPNAIQCIRQLYAAVQKQLPAYRSIQREFDGFSTEGGKLRAYLDGNNVRLIKASLFGETGRSDQEYYYTDTESLFFVFEKNSRYDRPFGKVAQVRTARFYFHDGKLIRWLNNANKPVSPSSSGYLEQQQKLLELSQGLLQTATQAAVETAVPTAVARQASVPQPLRALVPTIKQQTTVVVLLPDELPYTVRQHPLYAHGEASADSYAITLTSRPDCGANACLVGLFTAQRHGQMTVPWHALHADAGGVLLTGNIRAYYQPTRCGGSCSPPSIEWVSEGILYSMQFEVQWQTRLAPKDEQALIVGMANSALKAGPR